MCRRLNEPEFSLFRLHSPMRFSATLIEVVY